MSIESPTELLERIGIDPVLTSYSAKGYHGTSAEQADQIVLDGFDLRLAQPGLFGRGIYFFEDWAPHPGSQAVLGFLERRRSHWREVAVLAFDVNVGGERLFDLVAIGSNLRLFQSVQKEIIRMADEQGMLPSLDERTMGTATVEFIMRHSVGAHATEAVKARFTTPDLDPPYQDGGCARHKKCIANVQKTGLD